MAGKQYKQRQPEAVSCGGYDYYAEVGGGGDEGAAGINSEACVSGTVTGNERMTKMITILLEEMTGPVLPPSSEDEGSGEKRKARAAPIQYDLSDICRGKGTPDDPISFFELAEGAPAPVVAVSFYQVHR